MPQKLHAENKKVRRKGVALSDSSRRAKRIQAAPIEKKGSRDRGNTTHDELNKLVRKIEQKENFSNEAPLNPIIGLLQINLD